MNEWMLLLLYAYLGLNLWLYHRKDKLTRELLDRLGRLVEENAALRKALWHLSPAVYEETVLPFDGEKVA